MGFVSDFPKKQHPLGEQMERFGAIYDAYLARLDAGGGGRECHVTLLARSPASPMCRVFAGRAADFEKRGVVVQGIFARLGPSELMGPFLAAMRRVNGEAGVARALRWASNPSLLDAHEQLTLGQRMCWTGDSMRRSADARNALDLFEDNSLGSVRLADLAFIAMWSACKPLPGELLDEHGVTGDGMAESDAATIADSLIRRDQSAVVVRLRARA
jgi:hypothetical protein